MGFLKITFREVAVNFSTKRRWIQDLAGNRDGAEK
jgi:hypothetical protein